MDLRAKWIWKKREDYELYNDSALFRKTFQLSQPQSGRIAVSADSWFRLYVNGEWVADGPCRSWPEHYQYDVLDVTAYLRDGANEITAVARFFGTGTFHQVPCEAGFMLQLDAHTQAGDIQIATDDSWEAAEYATLLQWTPKLSVQMEPAEQIDAACEAEGFEPAVVRYSAGEGPWKDLHPRDVALLTRETVPLRAFLGASVVDARWRGAGFPIGQMLYPKLINASAQVSYACAVATCVVSDHEQELRVHAPRTTITVNGETSSDGVFQLKPGRNLLLATVTTFFNHCCHDIDLYIGDGGDFRLENPTEEQAESPWFLLRVDKARYITQEYEWHLTPPDEKKAIEDRIRGLLDQLIKDVVDVESLKAHPETKKGETIPEHMLMEQPHLQFVNRRVLRNAGDHVENPSALMYDNAETTVVHPADQGDVELVYDLGEQNCGYYSLDLTAPAGVNIDISGVEYITSNGAVQHTIDCRNGLRFTCTEGRNRFVSLKRRSQRYLFVTIRNASGPVRIRRLSLVESTYPINSQGTFACSDEELTRIWEISKRTLKLCMEDTFTDCPLYEQTLWVGDARNEALYAYAAFGAEDIAKRCIRLAGQSLEHTPMVLSQVPTSWHIVLPAWSFLWNLMVWECFQFSGDEDFLRDCWPWVRGNLDGAEQYVDEKGLFSVPFWNMFDWTPIDDQHATVVHNSMFHAAALEAGAKCAERLGEEDSRREFEQRRARMIDAINKLWDPERGAYPDALLDDGTPSERTCMHTSFLALLYDIAEGPVREQALQNLLEPPEDMTRVGSPFAIQYLYEALEKEGFEDRIVALIRENYGPMLEAGATTVWESFSEGSLRRGEFPTRSHCHAWSSAPIHFLNRIVLGIRPAAPGGKRFIISPRVNGLEWARGAAATIHGPLHVYWRRTEGRLEVDVAAPPGVEWEFASNDTHDGLEVVAGE